MKYNLFTTYHHVDDETRRKEYITCLENNSKVFNKIILLCENDSDKSEVLFITDALFDTMCIAINVKRRPTYNDFLDIMSSEEYVDSVNVLANSDIYFDDLSGIDSLLHEDSCLALSRWENGEHFNRADSQDSWIFLGKPSIRTSIDFCLGQLGCDNRFAHELVSCGYSVTNPSLSIRSNHLHTSSKRSYLDDNGNRIGEVVPPPYQLIIPT